MLSVPLPNVPRVQGGAAQIPVPKLVEENAPVVNDSEPVTEVVPMPITFETKEPPLPSITRPVTPPTAVPPWLEIQTKPGKHVVELFVVAE